MAAGTLIITEAGGLVGNFTGEADFLYQRELVAGNPKVYGQMIGLLAPFTRVIKADEAADGKPAGTAPVEALAAAMAAGIGASQATDSAGLVEREAARVEGEVAQVDPDAPAAPAERKTVRIRKTDMPAADPANAQRMGSPRHDGGDRPRGPRPDADRSRGTGRPAPGRPLPVKR